MRHKIASLAAIFLLANLITLTTAYINVNYIQSASAAPLITPTVSSSNNIVNTKSIYEITFTTATTGTVKSVEIILPRGSTASGTQLIERSGIGSGIISTSSGPNGPTITYTVSSPVSIAAGIPIRFELANLTNTSTPGNTAISITTKDTNGVAIDGPTNSVAYPMRQIAGVDIADNAITTNKILSGAVTPAKISQDNVYTAWDNTLKIHPRIGFDPPPIPIETHYKSASEKPTIAVSGNNVYLVWVNATFPRDIAVGEPVYNPHNILFKKSTDGGGTFGSRVTLGNKAAFLDQSIILGHGDNATYTPALAVSGNNVYVVWTGENKEILLRKSTDGGSTFGNIVELGTNRGYSASPSLAVSGNNVYVVWEDFIQGNREILLRKSTDGGANFGGIINLSNNPAESIFPSIAVSGNNVYVVWSESTSGIDHILFTSSSDGGAKFRTASSLSNNPGDYAVPAIAVLGNNVYVVWSAMWKDYYLTHNGEEQSILFRNSVDGGVTFGITINLGRALPYDFPSIAVS